MCGIVKQSGGHVFVRSELGRGTTFDVYLPSVEEAVVTAPSPTPSPRRGSETLLVVEDEDAVRAVTCSILRRQGYHVIEADGGAGALRACADPLVRIDLVISDVVMPQMSGPVLAKKIVELRPGTKILCMSGYTDDAALRHGVFESELAFLPKPVTVETLTRKVREVLDARAAG